MDETGKNRIGTERKKEVQNRTKQEEVSSNAVISRYSAHRSR